MISFIIPTLNEEKVIRTTLENLAGYSGTKEIIISDGNSSDATISIAREYTEKIFIYREQVRQTIAGGRNAGAKPAEGELLAFVDADVTIPDIDLFMKKAVGFFETDPNLVAITVEYRVLPELATLMDKIVFKILYWNFLFLNNVLHSGATGGEFMLVRKNAFQEIGGFNDALGMSEDVDLFQRLFKKGGVRAVSGLHIYHTGRRAHKLGWPKLLSQWILGWFSVTFLKKSFMSEWEEIR